MSTQKTKTLEVISNFIKAVDNTSYNGQLIDHVHQFFQSDGEMWEDNMWWYKELSVTLLRCLADKEISERLVKLAGEYSAGKMPAMIHSVYDFTRNIDTDNFRSRLEYFEVESEVDFDEKLIDIEIKYQNKLKWISDKSGKKIVDLIRDTERSKEPI